MKGSCRPTIAATVVAGRPVTEPSTVTGMPSAPKATGAVLKINTKTRASMAGKPVMMSSELVMATGAAPNPAIPSSRAPKQNPITTSMMRRSLGRLAIIHWRKASKRPDRTAML